MDRKNNVEKQAKGPLWKQERIVFRKQKDQVSREAKRPSKEMLKGLKRWGS